EVKRPFLSRFGKARVDPHAVVTFLVPEDNGHISLVHAILSAGVCNDDGSRRGELGRLGRAGGKVAVVVGAGHSIAAGVWRRVAGLVHGDQREVVHVVFGQVAVVERATATRGGEPRGIPGATTALLGP